MNTLKNLFLLDPEVIFLNHGSLGACPRPVFEVYQNWQRRLEDQPVKFMRELAGFDREARHALGTYLHANPDDLAFVTNATTGVNIIAHSLSLQPGDEILTTDQEYGACDNTWNFICRKTGAAYIHRAVMLPPDSPEDLVEKFWQGVTERTKMIYLSHLTSPTALRLPVEELCRRARQNGILTFIDGAHAPGQIPLDLEALGADFYTGNCHKWMMSPKGAGFLYARREVQRMVQPLVISWAYDPDETLANGASTMSYLTWNGTRDPSAFLSIPAAIEFMEEHHWDEVRQQCHALLHQAISRICDLTGLAPFYPLDSEFYSQMAIAPLPAEIDPAIMKNRLYDEYHIEIPVFQWHQHKVIRISVQGYNTPSDIDGLLKALGTLLR
jgi:isopenicillin-N epimerase